MGTAESGIFFAIIKQVSRWPNGLSCIPACQMETFSAFHVSTGPTEIAFVGTREIFPPPDVRAFCASVNGCKSTTRAVSLRDSAGGGGLFFHLPLRCGGSLNAQCFTSPCPPCITAQRTPVSQLLRSALVLALGKCRFESGITRS